jgi:hypothetical protein
MRAFNPRFDESVELRGAFEKFNRFRGRGDLYSGVVDDVPLAPASIEEQHQFVGLFPKGEAGALETESMMPRNSSHTVARAGRCHSRHLQGRVIRSCESAIL